jgi:hypothetical protein
MILSLTRVMFSSIMKHIAVAMDIIIGFGSMKVGQVIAVHKIVVGVEHFGAISISAGMLMGRIGF